MKKSKLTVKRKPSRAAARKVVKRGGSPGSTRSRATMVVRKGYGK